jgi:hypothetical protein
VASKVQSQFFIYFFFFTNQRGNQFGCSCTDLAVCTPPDVALPATSACHDPRCSAGGQPNAQIQFLCVLLLLLLLHSGPLARPSPAPVPGRTTRAPDCVHLCLLFTPARILCRSCLVRATTTGRPPPPPPPPYARCAGLRRILRRRGDEHPPGMRMRTPSSLSSFSAIWLSVFGSESRFYKCIMPTN